ncbi:MAG: carbohydrate-binding domain-containing protein [Prevotella sp.]|nr:carbohydrate-binding domain-containing protein [Prevotella sp.]
MKQILFTIATLLTGMAAAAQTLNVTTGGTTYQFPADQTGTMTFSGGTQMTIIGKTFDISQIGKMWTDDSSLKDNNVNIQYNGTEALVYVAGNIAQYVDVTISGAHVSIAQSSMVDDTVGEITYNLSGTSTDGEFAMSGSYKATVTLNGLTLTNPTGAPINITNGKRIEMSVKKDTENTLVDGAGGSQKGCLYVKGHLELKGKGILNITGNTSHSIKSGEYVEIKNCTVNILKSVKDGINCSQYFLMESGTLSMKSIGDDGIQCDLEGDTSTGMLTDHEDEDSGNIYLLGGTISAAITADACKGINAEGDMLIEGGDITITTSGGGLWDSKKLKTKSSSCLSADGNITISGGTLTLTSTGAGGKGINADGAFTLDGGTTIIKTSGNAVVASSNGTLSVVTNSRTLDNYDSDYKSSPKGVKVDGAIIINDGIIDVTTSGAGGEGIESKTSITFNGGQTIVSSSDDGINASYNSDTNGSGDMTVNGGYIYCISSGNDAMDSNGNFYVKGGFIYAVGTGSPEKSLDANTEQGKKLYITGGTLIAVGDLEGGAQISGGTCKYTSSWSKNAWYALYNGSTLAAAFKTPAATTGGGGGPWSGGSSNLKLIVYTSSTPALKSDVTVNEGTSILNGMVTIDGTISNGNTVTLSNYSSSSGGGGGPRW